MDGFGATWVTPLNLSLYFMSKSLGYGQVSLKYRSGKADVPYD